LSNQINSQQINKLTTMHWQKKKKMRILSVWTSTPSRKESIYLWRNPILVPQILY